MGAAYCDFGEANAKSVVRLNKRKSIYQAETETLCGGGIFKLAQAFLLTPTPQSFSRSTIGCKKKIFFFNHLHHRQ
jgi:hypothetical protein